MHPFSYFQSVFSDSEIIYFSVNFSPRRYVGKNTDFVHTGDYHYCLCRRRAANEIIGNRLNDMKGSKSEWKYIACGSLEETLLGADFVVISILPGTFDEMESDVHTPEKYGIYQSVGDTADPETVREWKFGLTSVKWRKDDLKKRL